MSNIPSNTDDVIDSRDVIERIEELEAENWSDLTDEERAELSILRDLAREGENVAADWMYGETLIRDDYFETYARDLAEEIGAIPADLSWPLYSIDWERAAIDLLADYSAVDFDGVTYWIR